jgi:hypothetical protein
MEGTESCCRKCEQGSTQQGDANITQTWYNPSMPAGLPEGTETKTGEGTTWILGYCSTFMGSIKV